MNFLTIVAKILTLPLVFLLSLAGYSFSSPNLGATLPQVPSIFETYLANAQGASDTSFTLASVTLRDGSTLSGYQCFTIDSNTTTLEYECGTVSGTTVSSLTRGIDAVTGTTTVSSLKYAHKRGADVKITDYPTLTILRNQLAGTETIPALIQYANTLLLGNNSATTTLATKYYVDNTAVSGAPNATTLVKGIVQLATALQTASSTVTGSTGANLLIPASNATDTPQSGCASGFTGVAGAGCSLVANLLGKISQTWLDLTQTWSFTGAVSIAASSVKNLTLNTVAYIWPSSQGGASTVLTNDGTGNLSWGTAGQVQLAATTTSVLMKYATTTFSPGSYQNVRIVYNATAGRSGGSLLLNFNTDFAGNYAASGQSAFGGVFATNYQSSSASNLNLDLNTGTTSPEFVIVDAINQSANVKVIQWKGDAYSSAAVSPGIFNGVGQWNNTSAQISTVVFNTDGTGIPSGTTIRIYGY